MTDDQYEADRFAALKERWQAQAEGPDRRSLQSQFGPGSFGCHEAVHTTLLVVELIEQQLANHCAVLLDPSWYMNVREAQAILHRAYSAAAQKHLDAPMPTGDRPPLTLVPNE